MTGDPSIKIRTIPRPNEKAAGKEARPPANRQWLLLISMSVAILALGAAGFYKSKATAVRTAKIPSKVAPVVRQGASINKNTYDTRVAELMMRRRIELENKRTMGMGSSSDGVHYLSEEDGRTMGVQLDQENTAERIYEDLYGEKSAFADRTPEERISNRLANRKWLNEMERAERLQFVRNFIRQAYDRGFEVELDQNLVVIGVKRIGAKKVNIDEVLSRLAKQGH